MIEIEVICKHCLHQFIVETHLPEIDRTVCPACKQWTDIDDDDKDKQ